jgi:aminoglycoside phosphotransferase (APT) family kinase protein
VPEWSAEVAVDEELVRRLLGEQFGELELKSVRLLGEGWDNAVWLVDERWIFRFPRRRIAVPGVERAIALLPRLAPLLPLPITEPVFAGRPGHAFSWPFYGAAWLPGREVAEAGLDDEARIRIARPLGEFLHALHSSQVEGADELPVDPLGRADMALRVPMTRERLAEAERLELWRAPDGVERALAEAEQLAPPAGLAQAHGDLHVRHVLVGDDGTPSGVIDWDDACRADPAIDLHLVWSLLPPDGRGELVAAYGPVSDEQLLRARVLALFLCAALALYAEHEGLDALRREALAGLERAATD